MAVAGELIVIIYELELAARSGSSLAREGCRDSTFSHSAPAARPPRGPSPPPPHASATKLIVSRRFTPARRCARLLLAARARCLPRGWGGGNRGWMERGAGGAGWRARVRDPGPGLAFLGPTRSRPLPSAPSPPSLNLILSAANWRALGIGEGRLLLEAFVPKVNFKGPSPSSPPLKTNGLLWISSPVLLARLTTTAITNR